MAPAPYKRGEKCAGSADCGRCLIHAHSNSTDRQCTPEGRCLGFDTRSAVQVVGRALAPMVLDGGALMMQENTTWPHALPHLVERMAWVRPEIRCVHGEVGGKGG